MLSPKQVRQVFLKGDLYSQITNQYFQESATELILSPHQWTIIHCLFSCISHLISIRILRETLSNTPRLNFYIPYLQHSTNASSIVMLFTNPRGHPPCLPQGTHGGLWWLLPPFLTEHILDYQSRMSPGTEIRNTNLQLLEFGPLPLLHLPLSLQLLNG